MVRLALSFEISCNGFESARQVLLTMQNHGLELAGFSEPTVQWDNQWLLDGLVVHIENLEFVGELSPVPFLALYNLVSLWAIVMEVEYTGSVVLPDGVEYDISGEMSFIDNSWKHDQRAGVYAGDTE